MEETQEGSADGSIRTTLQEAWIRPKDFFQGNPAGGYAIALDEQPVGVDQTPVQPFIGELAVKGDDVKNQHEYVPSLDPLRIAGKFRKPVDDKQAEVEDGKKDVKKSDKDD
ncbi:hypothetical protein LBMAG53_26970 [Planctomycetota bacterium]|nr:hypothetical protein LBMAG53_26970 [Planctomycetota bacterium]